MSKSEDKNLYSHCHSGEQSVYPCPACEWQEGWNAALSWAQEPGPCGHPQGCFGDVKRGEGVYELVCLVCEAERGAREKVILEAQQLWEGGCFTSQQLIVKLRAAQEKPQMTAEQFKDIAL